MVKYRRLLPAVILSLLWATSAQAQIAFGSATDFGQFLSSPATTGSFTTSGTNRILFLTLGSDTGSAAPTATFGGTSMTQVLTFDPANSVDRLTILCLTAPTTTPSTFTITFAGTTLEVGATYYTGASQTCTADSTATNSAATGTGISVTNTSVADNTWAIFMSADAVSTSGWTFTNLTQRLLLNGGNSGDTYADSNGVIHPAGSFTGSVSTAGGNQAWDAIQITFAPAAAAVTCVPTLRTLGVSDCG